MMLYVMLIFLIKIVTKSLCLTNMQYNNTLYCKSPTDCVSSESAIQAGDPSSNKVYLRSVDPRKLPVYRRKILHSTKLMCVYIFCIVLYNN